MGGTGGNEGTAATGAAVHAVHLSADITGLAQEEAQMQEALLRLQATIEAKRQQLGQLGV